MNSTEKKLLSFYNKLGPSEQDMLLTFAEFLIHRASGENLPVEPIPAPQNIPRPESETVVAAIKRLTATYPMLDKPELLNETSALMTKHVMQGMGAEEVVDELESLFLKFYEDLVSSSGGDKT